MVIVVMLVLFLIVHFREGQAPIPAPTPTLVRRPSIQMQPVRNTYAGPRAEPTQLVSFSRDIHTEFQEWKQNNELIFGKRGHVS